MSADQFVQYLVSGLTQGSVYALVGLGFTIIYTVTRIINFAQGEFVMLGGMLSFILLNSAGLPLAPAVLLSIVIVAVIGSLFQILVIRPARRATAVSLIIITIGASIFTRGIVGELWGKDPERPMHFTGEEPLSFLGASMDPQRLWIIGTAFVVMIILHLFFSYTIIGKALKGCSINSRAASLVGIDVKAMALVAFALAATLGAIGGIVTAPLSTTSYSVGVMLALKGFVGAAIGGFRSQFVAFIGGMSLGIIEAFAVAANWGPFTSAYKDAIAITVLLLILIIRAGRLEAEEM